MSSKDENKKLKEEKEKLKEKENKKLEEKEKEKLKEEKEKEKLKKEKENEKLKEEENKNENENENEDKDEITKILILSYEDYDDDEINNRIKKLNNHLDKMIDKSKSFEEQIKSLKKRNIQMIIIVSTILMIKS